jgi:hypothetical protein
MQPQDRHVKISPFTSPERLNFYANTELQLCYNYGTP